MITKSQKAAKTANDGTGAAPPTEAQSPETGTVPARQGKHLKPGDKAPRVASARQRPAAADGAAMAARKIRTDTKQAKLIAMLEAKDGATVEEIAAAFGWQAHTVRGALYGALKKKLGFDVTSEKVEGKGRVYRIGG